MKKLLFLFVILITVSSFVGCTEGILTEEENAQIEQNEEVFTSTDPDDDGTVDPDPEETGNEGG